MIAEVNDHCPRTAGRSIAWDRIDAVVHTSRPLLEAPVTRPGPTEAQIAAHVAAIVEDGDTIQLGVGALPEAILAALSGHRDLGVHSGMVSDGVLDLIEAGAVTNARKPADRGLTVTGAALGSGRLFEALNRHQEIRFFPVSYTHAPGTLATVGRLASINSAVEVDLTGQVNAEEVGGRRLGAVGGQVDFLRAAAAHGGKPIHRAAGEADRGEAGRSGQHRPQRRRLDRHRARRMLAARSLRNGAHRAASAGRWRRACRIALARAARLVQSSGAKRRLTSPLEVVVLAGHDPLCVQAAPRLEVGDRPPAAVEAIAGRGTGDLDRARSCVAIDMAIMKRGRPARASNARLGVIALHNEFEETSQRGNLPSCARVS